MRISPIGPPDTLKLFMLGDFFVYFASIALGVIIYSIL